MACCRNDLSAIILQSLQGARRAPVGQREGKKKMIATVQQGLKAGNVI